MKELPLHKITSTPGGTEEIFGQKAEDTLRKMMQSSRLSLANPAVIERISSEIQLLAVQRSIRRRRRTVFLWTLLSLICGGTAIILTTRFTQHDTTLGLTQNLAQNMHQTVIGVSGLRFWILPLLGVLICLLLVELLMASFKTGKKVDLHRHLV